MIIQPAAVPMPHSFRLSELRSDDVSEPSGRDIGSVSDDGGGNSFQYILNCYVPFCPICLSLAKLFCQSKPSTIECANRKLNAIPSNVPCSLLFMHSLCMASHIYTYMYTYIAIYTTQRARHTQHLYGAWK